MCHVPVTVCQPALPAGKRLCSVRDFLGVITPIAAGGWLPTHHQLAGWTPAPSSIHIPPGRHGCVSAPRSGPGTWRALGKCLQRERKKGGWGERKEGRGEGGRETERRHTYGLTESHTAPQSLSPLRSFPQSIRVSHNYTQAIASQTLSHRHCVTTTYDTVTRSHRHNRSHPQGPYSHTKCNTWGTVIITSDIHTLHHGHTHHTHTHTHNITHKHMQPKVPP